MGSLPGDVGEQSSFSKLSVTSPTSQLILILQAFRHFTYVTAHSPTLPSLYLRHSSFSNPSVASPTSQLILQPFFRFSCVRGFSVTSPGEPPLLLFSFLLTTFPCEGVSAHKSVLVTDFFCIYTWCWHHRTFCMQEEDTDLHNSSPRSMIARFYRHHDTGRPRGRTFIFSLASCLDAVRTLTL